MLEWVGRSYLVRADHRRWVRSVYPSALVECAWDRAWLTEVDEVSVVIHAGDRLRFVQLCLDVVDPPAARAFWTSALGYRTDPREDVADIYDPRRLSPVLIFQRMDSSDGARRRQRDRIRLVLNAGLGCLTPRATNWIS